MSVAVTTVVGVVVAWLLTVPLFRFKELRPLQRRDVASEADLVIRAVYRRARYAHSTVDVTLGDVVPLVSWVLPGARTRQRVPTSVIALQVGLPLAMALTAIRFDSVPLIVAYCSFCVLAAAVATVDARIWLIPWWMPWAGTTAAAVLLSLAAVDLGEPERLIWAVGGALGAFLLFFVLFLVAPGKLGFGDVRLAAPIGVFAGFVSPLLVLWALMLGSVLGVLLGLGSVLSGKDRHFAFGPPLAIGALLAIWSSRILLG